MDFFNEPFEIPQEEKIVIYRFNNGNISPFLYGAEWDLSAKAVKADGEGIFGLSLDHLHSDMSSAILNGFHICKENIKFLKLESSKKDVLSARKNEVSVAKANIIQSITAEEFTNEFPLYKDLFTMQKAYCNPYVDSGELYKEAYTRASSLREAGRKWMFSKNDINIHGFAHSARVDRNAQILAKLYRIKNEVLAALNIFAFYHDLQRYNDGSDIDHGKRASIHLKSIRRVSHIGFVSDDLFEKLCFACENHTTMLRSGDLFVDICFDADRLDLTRIGTTIDPNMMATTLGAHFAENMEIFRVEFHNIEC